MPVLPAVLLNGAEGIGTGWSTSIPNYRPADIVDNLKRLLDGEQLEPMQPWYRGFKGEIKEVGQGAQGEGRGRWEGGQGREGCAERGGRVGLWSAADRRVCPMCCACTQNSTVQRSTAQHNLSKPLLPYARPPPACRQVPTKTSGKSYQINGVITQVDDTTLEISELPIRKWTQVRGSWGVAGARRGAC